MLQNEGVLKCTSRCGYLNEFIRDSCPGLDKFSTMPDCTKALGAVIFTYMIIVREHLRLKYSQRRSETTEKNGGQPLNCE